MSRRYGLALTGAMVWLTVVILIYYWVHKPLTKTFGQAFGLALVHIAVTVLLTVVAGGLGWWLLQRFNWADGLMLGEHLALAGLLGLGVLADLILLVGAVWLHPLSIALLLAIVAALTWQALWEWLTGLRLYVSGWSQLQGLNRWLLYFVVLNLVMAFLMALAPPTKFDALTYHLVGPKHWLSEGRFVPLEGSHFFGFPQLVNMLYAAYMALTFGDFVGATLIHWVIGCLGLMAIGGYGTRRLNLRVGLMAVVILLTATSIWLEFSWPYVDLGAIAFSIAVLIGLDRWRDTQEVRWLILVGVLLGLAMSIKYPLLALGLSSGLYVLAFTRPRPQIIRNGLILVGVGALVLLPWLIRNALWYDNPLYPFGPASADWDAIDREWYTGAEHALIHTVPWMWYTSPLMSTFFGVEGTGNFRETIGPLFLLLIPFIGLTWRQVELQWRQAYKELALMALGFAVLWQVSSALTVYGSQFRLWYGMFPPLALLAAASFDRLQVLPKKPLAIGFVIQALVLFVVALTALDHVRGTRSTGGALEGTTRSNHFVAGGSLQYLLGIIDEDKYLEDGLGWYIVAMRQVNELPDDAYVLFLWETRSLYCDEPRITCYEDSIIGQWWHDRRAVGDGSAMAIVDNWRDQGFTHILVRDDGRDYEFDWNTYYTEADKTEWELVPPLMPTIIWQEGDYTLYAFSELR